ncbi:centrosome-associated protein CEP250 isoform X2 [Drosophila ficusphila]|uniref:centrosome-associated protein CEP250 isoform X2 n=1 Tax=Drosophila ficusphila TaxID=30025 RepID=UPI0007E6157A|nr:centrosome-associated protein CEP250 isoform X2 [Drosophila ficusphila]
MDLRSWGKVLVCWVKECHFISDSFSSLEHSDINAFFRAFVKEVNAEAVVKEALQDQPKKRRNPLQAFLRAIYPEFNAHVNESGRLVHSEYLYAYTLLLHYSCVKVPTLFFHNLCKALPEQIQACIVALFEQTVDQPLTRQYLRQSIANVASVSRQGVPVSPSQPSPEKADNDVNSSPCSSRPTSPLPADSTPRLRQTPILQTSDSDTPQTPKTELLEARTRELRGVQAQLAVMSYEKNVLEEQTVEWEGLVKTLDKENKIAKSELAKLKESKAQTEEEEADLAPRCDEFEHLKRSLLKEISLKEAIIAETNDKLMDLHMEKSELIEELKMSGEQLMMSMDRNRELEARLDAINLSLTIKDNQIRSLESDKEELERCLQEAREELHSRREVLNASSDLLDCSLSPQTSPPENLASAVIDKQLREKEHENLELRDELQKQNDSIRRLTQAVTGIVKRYDPELELLDNPDKQLDQLLDKCQTLAQEAQTKIVNLETESAKAFRKHQKKEHKFEMELCDRDIALVNLRAENEALTESRDQLKERVADLSCIEYQLTQKEQQLNQLGAQIMELRNKNASLERSLERFEEDRSADAKLLQQKQNCCDYLRSKYDQCRSLLKTSNEDMAMLSEQLRVDGWLNVVKRVGELVEVQAQHEDLKRDHADLETRLQVSLKVHNELLESRKLQHIDFTQWHEADLRHAEFVEKSKAKEQEYQNVQQRNTAVIQMLKADLDKMEKEQQNAQQEKERFLSRINSLVRTESTEKSSVSGETIEGYEEVVLLLEQQISKAATLNAIVNDQIGQLAELGRQKDTDTDESSRLAIKTMCKGKYSEQVIASLEATLKKWHATLKSKEAEMASKAQELSQLQSIMQRSTNELSWSQNLEDEAASVKRTIKDRLRTFGVLTKATEGGGEGLIYWVNEFVTTFNEMAMSRDVLERRCENTNGIVEQLQRKKAQLEEQMVQLQGQVVQLQDQSEQMAFSPTGPKWKHLRDTINNLEEVNSRLSSDNVELHKKHCALSQTLFDSHTEVGRHASKIVELEAAEKRKTGELYECQRKYDELKAEQTATEEKISKLKDSYEKQIEELKAKCEQGSKDAKKEVAETEHSEGKLQESKEEIQKLKEENIENSQQLKDAKEDYEKRCQELEKQKEELESKLKTLEAECQQRSEKVANNAGNDDELRTLKWQLEEARQLEQQLRQTLSTHKQIMEESCAELEESRYQLGTLRQTIAAHQKILSESSAQGEAGELQEKLLQQLQSVMNGGESGFEVAGLPSEVMRHRQSGSSGASKAKAQAELVAKLRRENKSLQRELEAQVSKEEAHLAEGKARLHRENEALKKELEEARRREKQLGQQKPTVEVKYARTLAAQTDLVGKLQHQKETLRKELDAIRAREKQSRHPRPSGRSPEPRYSRDRTPQTETLAKLRREKETLQHELDTARQTIESKEQVISESHAELEAFRRDKNKLLEQAELQLSQARADLETQNELVEYVKKQKEQVQQELDEARHHESSTEMQLAERHAMLDSQVEFLETLQQDKEAAQRKLEEISLQEKELREQLLNRSNNEQARDSLANLYMEKVSVQADLDKAQLVEKMLRLGVNRCLQAERDHAETRAVLETLVVSTESSQREFARLVELQMRQEAEAAEGNGMPEENLSVGGILRELEKSDSQEFESHAVMENQKQPTNGLKKEQCEESQQPSNTLKELAEVKASFEELRESLARLQIEKESVGQELEKARLQEKQQREQMRELTEAKISLEKQTMLLASLESEKESVQRELEEIRLRENQLLAQIQNGSKAEQELEKQTELLSYLENERKSALRELEEARLLEKQLLEQVQKGSQAELELKKQTELLFNLEREKKSVERELEEIRLREQHLRERVQKGSTAEQQLEKQTEQLFKLEREKESAQRELDEARLLEKQLREQIQKGSQAEEKLAEAKALLTKQTELLGLLECENTSLQRDLEESCKLQKELQEQLNIKSIAEMELAEAKTSLEKQTESVAKLQSEKIKIEGDLEESRKLQKDLQEQLKNKSIAEVELADAKASLERQSESLARLQREKDAVEQELEKARLQERKQHWQLQEFIDANSSLEKQTESMAKLLSQKKNIERDLEESRKQEKKLLDQLKNKSIAEQELSEAKVLLDKQTEFLAKLQSEKINVERDLEEARSQEKQLRQQVENGLIAEQELSKVKIELASQTSRSAKLLYEKNAAERELEKVRLVEANLRQQMQNNASGQQEKERLSEVLSEKQALQRELQMARDRLMKAERDHQAKMSTLEDQVDTLERGQNLEIGALNSEIEQLKRRLAERANHVVEMQQRLDKEVVERNHLQEELGLVTDQLASKSELELRLGVEIAGRKQAEEQLAEINERMAEVNQELDGTRLVHEAQQFELEEKTREIERERAETVERILSYERRLETLEHQLAESNQMLAESNQKLAEIQAEIQANETQGPSDLGATYSKADVPESDGSLGELTARNNKLALDCQILQAKYRDAKEEIQRCEQKIKDQRLEMEGKLDKMKTKMDGPHSLDDSMSALLSSSGTGTRKKSMGTHYKRPGPPTPSKNGGRLSFGSSEPPREILREFGDHSNTGKTPARFKFLTQRFSVGSSGLPRDELPRRQRPNLLTGVHRRILREAVGLFCTSTPRKSRSYYDHQRMIRASDPKTSAANEEDQEELVEEQEEEEEVVVEEEVEEHPTEDQAEQQGTPHLSNAALLAMTKGNTRRLTGQAKLCKGRVSLCLHGNIFAKSRPPALKSTGTRVQLRRKMRQERMGRFDKARHLDQMYTSGNVSYAVQKSGSGDNNNYSFHNRNEDRVERPLVMGKTVVVEGRRGIGSPAVAATFSVEKHNTTWQMQQQFETENQATWTLANGESALEQESQEDWRFEQLCQETESTAPFQLQPHIYKPAEMPAELQLPQLAASRSSNMTGCSCTTNVTSVSSCTTYSMGSVHMQPLPQINITYVRPTSSQMHNKSTDNRSPMARIWRALRNLRFGERVIVGLLLLAIVDWARRLQVTDWCWW